MLEITVNGKTLGAESGQTLLAALQRHGIVVPTLCNLPELRPSGACRLCVVEVEGMPGLVPACSYPVAEGMKIHTSSARVVEARRTIVELLLGRHPDDCLFCERSGTCTLQSLARDLGVQRRFRSARNEGGGLDLAGPIRRDPQKCILCGRCVRICEEVQGVSAIDFIGRGAHTVVGPSFGRSLALSACVACGQCIKVCPTGALSERSAIVEVSAALADPAKRVVFQHAPAVSVSLAERFGLEPGSDVCGQLVAALRRLGAHRVFDTAFAADLTIMEEASELLHRLQHGGPLPLLTSCSPAWVQLVEQSYPDLIGNLSTCKSPQQMLGALIKRVLAAREGLRPDQVVSVSVMPCTAKKLECAREEHGQDFVPDVDHVLTTRELERLLRQQGVDLGSLDPELADNPFGERSGAGKIFGASGGVMEAALRSAHFLLTGRELPELEIRPARGLEGVRELQIAVEGLTLRAAVVSGLANARRLLEELREGRQDLQFVEVMSCPGGCLAGGGQPIADPALLRARQSALYRIDQEAAVRGSHSNPWVQRLYAEVLGEPLGPRSHELLHTHYRSREAEPALTSITRAGSPRVAGCGGAP